ncbi:MULTISPECIES: hypothetical protein [Kitasatospora]|uniref:Uncharacterized protein n=1 Tax=Kitasatospora setae (strain ATCC 33774 / DSM 43861 / JCM 3304 / KCC A-0304 / NBRC 14216 / KM-6054) TaxID=452652 RepID=E4MZ07_KITSK|nr:MULTISPECIES: hypothetical protein [Kitasatospora]BAJ25900.1 hypothetical protein KSE_00490t [Kitasatospora setae KM-6054]BAJ33378.1 hypothetical protein KSE_76250t [Kitasatospora setae KM-6054]
MHRTRLTEFFPLHHQVGPEPTVPRGFVHPERGRVACPAAPLVEAHLRAEGLLTGAGGPAPELLPVPAQRVRDGGVLACTTYIDLDGSVTGIAVTAPRALETAARDAVQRWAAVLRTRRIVIALGEPCRQAARSAPGHAGCPKAAATRELVRQYRERGDTVLVLGAAGECDSASAHALPDVAAALRFEPDDDTRLSFVLAPCSPVEAAMPVLRVLRARFPALRGQHPDQWCYAASDARLGARMVTETSDLVLDLGASAAPTDGADAPSRRTVRRVRTLADLRPEELAAAATVGVLPQLSGRERPDDSPTVTDVIEVLSGLGPLSVVHHRASTDVSTNVYERSALAHSAR